ncbi:MAG: hypothetical protein M1829_003868 [Trizodia sp. TS-e1964]|nr:MAG: hypothetical protein M1829_003868 [Trizodia sp. TS-e1964]
MISPSLLTYAFCMLLTTTFCLASSTPPPYKALDSNHRDAAIVQRSAQAEQPPLPAGSTLRYILLRGTGFNGIMGSATPKSHVPLVECEVRYPDGSSAPWHCSGSKGMAPPSSLTYTI